MKYNDAWQYCVNDYYVKQVWGDIAEHWKTQIDSYIVRSVAYQERLATEKPWFGDITTFWYTFVKCKSVNQHVFERFPANIRTLAEYRKKGEMSQKQLRLLSDMDYLFPNKNTIRSVLPLLLTLFCFNKKPNDTFAERLYLGEFQLSKDANLPNEVKQKMRLYGGIEPVEREYYKLASDARFFSLTDISRVLPIYLKTISFFLFLTNLPESNSALSLFIFDAMAGYPSLINHQMRRFVNILGSKDEKSILDKDTALDEEIIDYIKKNILEDFQQLRIPHEKKRNEPYLQYGVNFGTFMANLQGYFLDIATDADSAAPLAHGLDILWELDHRIESGVDSLLSRAEMAELDEVDAEDPREPSSYLCHFD